MTVLWNFISTSSVAPGSTHVLNSICAAKAGPTVDASIITAKDATKIPVRDT